MSLYGKARVAATKPAAPMSQQDILRLSFKWAFLYLGVATLLNWLIVGLDVRRILFSSPTLIRDIKAEWLLGLLVCFLYLGIAIWASMKRSVPALSILIGFSAVGLACWAYPAMSGPLEYYVAGHDQAVLRFTAAFINRGTAFSWLLELAQQDGIRITAPVSMVLEIAQYLLTGGFCVFALMKQPKAK
jgi:hypothetical protein